MTPLVQQANADVCFARGSRGHPRRKLVVSRRVKSLGKQLIIFFCQTRDERPILNEGRRRDEEKRGGRIPRRQSSGE